MAANDPIVKTYLSFRSHLARVVSRLVPPHEIEDIVQETYVRVCQFRSNQGPGENSSEDTHDPRSSHEDIHEPRALMVRIARNLALDHLKRAETRLTSTLEEDWGTGLDALARQADQTYRQAASDEEFSQFCEAVRHLPLQCRRVFVLKKVYGYSQKEIAGELQLSESTVEKHISKGMKLCTRYLFNPSKNAGASVARTLRASAAPGSEP